MSTTHRLCPRRTHLGYLVSVVSVVAAVLFLCAGWRVFSHAPFLLIIPAVVVSAWVGGIGPGILATLLSVLGFKSLLLLMPEQGYTSAEAIALVLVFVAVSLMISYLLNDRLALRSAVGSANQQLETILNHVVDGVTEQLPTGQVVYANPAAADLLGYASVEALLDASPTEIRDRYLFFGKDGNPMPREALPNYRSLQSGNACEGIIRMVDTVTETNRWLLLKTVPFTSTHDGLRKMVNVFQDITERKKREENTAHLTLLLETQRNRLRNTLHNVPGIVWEGSNYGVHLEFVSDYAEHLLGYSKKEWLTTEDFWRVIVHPDDWHRTESHIRHVADSGQYEQVEFRCISKDGRVVPLQLHFTIIPDADGGASGQICGVLIDISQRKRAEDALRRSNADLQQFAYVASHDLQEPLRMISSYLQLIEQRYGNQLDTDGREFIHFAVDGAKRMKALITDLLAFSRVQTRTLEPQCISVGDLVAATLRNLSVVIDESDAQIHYEALPTISADSRQVTQLLQNLISNAIKFRHPDRPPTIRLSAERSANMWCFAVVDNGIGIEPQYRERIFQIFQRLHGIGTYEGTGIGLAICKKVVENHGGEIWLGSALDVGSSFYFTLPAS